MNCQINIRTVQDSDIEPIVVDKYDALQWKTRKFSPYENNLRYSHSYTYIIMLLLTHY